jgi:hypothetical protein
MKTAVQSTVRPTSGVRSNVQVVQLVVSAEDNTQTFQRLDFETNFFETDCNVLGKTSLKRAIR